MESEQNVIGSKCDCKLNVDMKVYEDAQGLKHEDFLFMPFCVVEPHINLT